MMNNTLFKFKYLSKDMVRETRTFGRMIMDMIY